MTSAHLDEVRKILVAQFTQSWQSGTPPRLTEYISVFAPQMRESIANQLIPIDIDNRIQRGEKPDSQDYQHLGQASVDAAAKALGQTVDSDSFVPADFDWLKDESPQSSKADTACLTQHEHQAFPSEGPLRPHQCIGPYRLISQIGTGGMGVVWKAEQVAPVRRLVALKVIRVDINSRLANTRFDAERQAIAMMDHPNIARILDAGTTENGSPYFAMELVDGIPLDDYCTKHKLGIRERLEIMLPVCRAIQHAHQKGILHRDLKHNNVLVASSDGAPVPKVIDFGLAKAFEGHEVLTPASFQTEYGKVVGTLQYMSPEQASGESDKIDTRSDVYSLGVMFYKLLTGKTPVTAEAVRSQTLIKVLEIIQKVEPERPSHSIESYDDDEKRWIAESFGQRVERVASTLRHDLDWIALKAIEKDPEARYETAHALQLDLERYLRNEDVNASPPSTFNRLKKFNRRNRLLVRAAATVFLVLLTGIIGTSFGLAWALREQRRANQNAIAASRAARLARDAQTLAESRLHATRVKSAWANWNLGKTEFAWKTLRKLISPNSNWESHFLASQFSSSLRVLYGHALGVSGVDAASVGEIIASISPDNSIRIWNQTTGECEKVLYVSDTPNQAVFSVDSTKLFVVGRDNRLLVFDTESWKQIAEHGPYRSDLLCVAPLENAEQVIVGLSNEDKTGFNRFEQTIGTCEPTIALIDVVTGRILYESPELENPVTFLSAHENIVASGAAGGELQILELTAGTLQHQLTIQTGLTDIYEICICPFGKHILICGDDPSFRMYRVNDGKLEQVFAGHDHDVRGVDFSFDGQRIASCAEDAMLWDLNGESLFRCRGHYSQMSAIQFLGTDHLFVTASDDSTLRVWNSKSNRNKVQTQVHENLIWQADFSGDGSTVFSASEDKTVRAVDSRTGTELKQFQFDFQALSLHHSPKAKLLAVGLAANEVVVIDTSNMEILKRITIKNEPGIYVWDVCFSPDGSQLASTSSTGTVSFWNTTDWSLESTLLAHDEELASIRFSNDGSRLLSSADDRLVKVWDADQHTLEMTLTGHRHPVWRAVFSPDDTVIASSSQGGELMIWDAATGEVRHQIKAHQSQIAGLTFTEDSSRIVTASDDGSIKIWDAVTGMELMVLYDEGNTSIVHASFSPKGDLLVTGNQGGWLTLRSTGIEMSMQNLPPLPFEVIEMETQGLRDVTAPNTDLQRLDALRKQFQYNLAHFPSYESHTVAGVACFRLGQIQQSIQHLEQAYRLEKIEYGERDLPPVIEAFLTAGYCRCERFTDAQPIYEELKQKLSQWTNNQDLENVLEYLDGDLSKLETLAAR